MTGQDSSRALAERLIDLVDSVTDRGLKVRVLEGALEALVSEALTHVESDRIRLMVALDSERVAHARTALAAITTLLELLERSIPS